MGSSLSGWPADIGVGASEPAVVADLDLDGEVELVVSARFPTARLVLLSHTGAVVPGWPQTLSNDVSFGGFPVVGDLDNDGDLEIVAVSSAGGVGRIHAFHHTGVSVAGWPVEPGVNHVSPPVLGDLEQNGSLEIVAGAAINDPVGQLLYVWDGAGTVKPGWPYTSPATTDAPFWTAILVDIDSDGIAEVIAPRSPENFSLEFLSPFGFPLQAFRHDGTLIPEFARPAFGGGGVEDASPGVGDMDGDGLLELAWTEVSFDFMTGRLRVQNLVWDLATPANTYKPWPMFRRDARHSASAPSTLPVFRLTPANMGQNFLIDRVEDFALHTGAQGVLQLIHPYQAAVKYSIDGGPLLNTPQPWGGPISVPANTDIVFRIVTPSAMSANVQWW